MPKGVLTTHRNLAAAAETSPYWEFDADSVSLTALPMFHIGGIGWAFLGLWNGATTVLVSDFVAGDVLDVIERQHVTNAVLVPTMIQMLLGVDGAAERDFSALRSIAYGASPITTPVLKSALRTFGCSLYGIYGLTESTGGVMQLDPADHDPGRSTRASAAQRRPPVPMGGAADRRSGHRRRARRRARPARCGCARRMSRLVTSTGPRRRQPR